MKKISLINLCVFIIFLATSSVIAKPEFHGDHKEGPPEEIMKKLNLSKDQMDKMHKLEKKHRSEIRGTEKRIMQAMKDMEKMIKTGNFNKRDVDNIVGKIGKMQTFMMRHSLYHLLDIKKILTPEQFKQVLEMGPPGGKEMGMHMMGNREGPDMDMHSDEMDSHEYDYSMD